jgi:hypothetical protein
MSDMSVTLTQLSIATLTARPSTEEVARYSLLNPTVSELKGQIAAAKKIGSESIYVFEMYVFMIDHVPANKVRYLSDDAILTAGKKLCYAVKHAPDNTPSVDRDNATDLTITLRQTMVSLFTKATYAANDSFPAPKFQTDCISYISQLWGEKPDNVVFWDSLLSGPVLADIAINPYYWKDFATESTRSLIVRYIFNTFPSTPIRGVLEISGKRVNFTAANDSHGSIHKAISDQLRILNLEWPIAQNLYCDILFNGDNNEHGKGTEWIETTIGTVFTDDGPDVRLSDKLFHSLEYLNLLVSDASITLEKQIVEAWQNDILLRTLGFGIVNNNTANNDADGVVVTIALGLPMPEPVGTNVIAWMPESAALDHDGYRVKYNMPHYYIVPNDTIAQLKDMIARDLQTEVKLYRGVVTSTHVDPVINMTGTLVYSPKDSELLSNYGNSLTGHIGGGFNVEVRTAAQVDKIVCSLCDVTRYGHEFNIASIITELSTAGPDAKHDVIDTIASCWGFSDSAGNIGITSVMGNSVSAVISERSFNPIEDDGFYYTLLSAPPKSGALTFIQSYGSLPITNTVTATGDTYEELKAAIVLSLPISDETLRSKVLNGPLVMNIALSFNPNNGCLSSYKSTAIVVRTTYRFDDVTKPTLCRKLLDQLKTESRITDSITGQPDSLVSNTQEQHGWISDIIGTYRDIELTNNATNTLYIAWGFDDDHEIDYVPDTVAKQSICTQIGILFQKAFGWFYATLDKEIRSL